MQRLPAAPILEKQKRESPSSKQNESGTSKKECVMFHGLFLGILGGLAAAKLVSGCRSGGCGGRAACGGSECGPGGGRWGSWRGYGHGRGGRFGMFRLVHELHLSREQWREAEGILHELRSTLHGGRDELRGSAIPVISILAASEFSAAQAEEVAAKHDATYARLRKETLLALERLHRILTPEQRARLQRFLAETRDLG
jgi:Spy/CpxP family protein refolding chaperone